MFSKDSFLKSTPNVKDFPCSNESEIPSLLISNMLSALNVRFVLE